MVIQNMSSNTKLRYAVRYLLETDGISVRELARRAEKPHAHVSRMLRGQIASSTLDQWDALASALNTTVGELLNMPDKEVVTAKNRRELLALLPRLPAGRKKRKLAAAS